MRADQRKTAKCRYDGDDQRQRKRNGDTYQVLATVFEVYFDLHFCQLHCRKCDKSYEQIQARRSGDSQPCNVYIIYKSRKKGRTGNKDNGTDQNRKIFLRFFILIFSLEYPSKIDPPQG